MNIVDTAMEFVRENKGVKKLENVYYTSPRISSEFMDCSLPFTFDQYNFCLIGSTLINTLNGQKPIKDIKIGDKVWSYNIKKQKYEKSEVTDTMNRVVTEYYKITIGKRSLSITGNHKVFTQRGWIETQYLTTNDKVLMLSKSDACKMGWSKELKEKTKKRMLGTTHTEKTKQKMHENNIEKRHTNKTKNIMKKRWTLERKEKTKKFLKKYWTKDNRKKQSKICKKDWKDNTIRKENISKRMKNNNPMKRTEIRKKQSKSLKKSYKTGELDLLKKKLAISGSENIKKVNRTPEHRKRVSERMKRNNARAIMSSLKIIPNSQLLLYKCLNYLNIPFIHECPIKLKNKTIIVDAFLPENNIIIEVDNNGHKKNIDNIRDLKTKILGYTTIRLEVNEYFCEKNIIDVVMKNVA